MIFTKMEISLSVSLSHTNYLVTFSVISICFLKKVLTIHFFLVALQASKFLGTPQFLSMEISLSLYIKARETSRLVLGFKSCFHYCPQLKGRGDSEANTYF